MTGLRVILAHWIGLLARDVRGNALAIFAGALLPLTAMIGGGVDMGIGYMAQAKLQNACDAGVLAARQSMRGNLFTAANETEGQRFFAFNFPDGIYGIDDAALEITQSDTDKAQLLGYASAKVPTAIMAVFGYDQIPISAACDARRDLGYNDVMLVLDVTGSMNSAPSGGGQKKIVRLRSGAKGLYQSLAAADSPGTTRFGMVAYSVTANVGRLLSNSDFVKNQHHWTTRQGCAFVLWGICFGSKTEVGNFLVNIRDTKWGRNNDEQQSLTAFRTSGDACVEERPSEGYTQDDYQIRDTVTRNDIDRRATGPDDTSRQFGRYDPESMADPGGHSCPSEALPLTNYSNQGSFVSDVNKVTQRVGGNTYHDAGMLWGLRLISPTGFFAADNPTTRNGVVVNKHIVFMTDGVQEVNANGYTEDSRDSQMNRVRGSGSLDTIHRARFLATCNLAKSMGITVWVIVLDTKPNPEVEQCATSGATYFYSDGNDLEQVFSDIGAGIGRLRLTK
ncbi:pilus assembly protein TadG-related protein [Erythrobacter sp. LQ02-29]|uniref:Tad domain-containing protein n=1 Tax=Erythrobacter sp. LQ02-29 TaxID=2920384 RepID=UPI001F4E68A7|nr:Tad domain-containing protein [Erythrobacter sp. LQ02-29]MCP9222844.1 pilus assembly protein TadG-related protein [Erythrobacter sp. LQ02-29]